MAISLLLKLNFELITHSLSLKGAPSNLEGEFLYSYFLCHVIPQNRLVDFDWNLYNNIVVRDSNPRLAARWSDVIFLLFKPKT